MSGLFVTNLLQQGGTIYTPVNHAKPPFYSETFKRNGGCGNNNKVVGSLRESLAGTCLDKPLSPGHGGYVDHQSIGWIVCALAGRKAQVAL